MSDGNGTPSPPNDLDAEVSVLGALLLDNSVGPAIFPLLTPESFYRESHGIIYRAIISDLEDGRGVDAVLLRARLERDGNLDKVGGPEVFPAILDKVPTAAHAVHYAKIVAELSARRRLEAFFSVGRDAARNGTHDAQDIIQKATAALVKFAAESMSFARVRKFKTVPDLLASQAERTPWLVDGLVSEGAVTVVAGLPKAGKSTLIYSLLSNLERGEPWCECPVENPATAVVLSEESPHHIAQKCQRFGVEKAVFLDKTDMFPQRPLAESVDFAIAKAREVGAKLILVDTYARWAGLGPDGEKDAGTVQESLVPLMRAAAEGFAVVLIHHHKKAEGDQGTQLRGSGALLADVEHLVEVRRIKDNLASPFRELTVTSRDPTAPAEPFVVELGPRSYRRAGALVDIQSAITQERILEELRKARPRYLGREELAEAVGGKATGFGVALKRLSEPKDGFPRVARIGNGKRGDPYLYGDMGLPTVAGLPGPVAPSTTETPAGWGPPAPSQGPSEGLFQAPPPEPREDGPALPPEGAPESPEECDEEGRRADLVLPEDPRPEPEAFPVEPQGVPEDFDPLAGAIVEGPPAAAEPPPGLVPGPEEGREPDPLDDLLGPA